MVLTFRSAAALRSQRLLVRYGLLEAQLHRGVMQCWQGMVSAALKRRCWQGQYDRLQFQLHLEVRRWWQGTDCYKCSCTGKRGDGSKVWVIMGVATLGRLAVVPR